MSDYAKVRAILDAATPGPWQRWYDDYEAGNWCIGPTPETAGDVASTVPDNDARAIVVSRNLTPALLAVAEAAEALGHGADSSLPCDICRALDALDAEVEKL